MPQYIRKLIGMRIRPPGMNDLYIERAALLLGVQQCLVAEYPLNEGFIKALTSARMGESTHTHSSAHEELATLRGAVRQTISKEAP